MLTGEQSPSLPSGPGNNIAFNPAVALNAAGAPYTGSSSQAPYPYELPPRKPSSQTDYQTLPVPPTGNQVQDKYDKLSTANANRGDKVESHSAQPSSHFMPEDRIDVRPSSQRPSSQRPSGSTNTNSDDRFGGAGEDNGSDGGPRSQRPSLSNSNQPGRNDRIDDKNDRDFPPSSWPATDPDDREEVYRSADRSRRTTFNAKPDPDDRIPMLSQRPTQERNIDPLPDDDDDFYPRPLSSKNRSPSNGLQQPSRSVQSQSNQNQARKRSFTIA